MYNASKRCLANASLTNTHIRTAPFAALRMTKGMRSWIRTSISSNYVLSHPELRGAAADTKATKLITD
eukprot:5551156-Pyramimonas_sp.AAC.1